MRRAQARVASDICGGAFDSVNDLLHKEARNQARFLLVAMLPQLVAPVQQEELRLTLRLLPSVEHQPQFHRAVTETVADRVDGCFGGGAFGGGWVD